jgi:hypothetical protein
MTRSFKVIILVIVVITVVILFLAVSSSRSRIEQREATKKMVTIYAATHPPVVTAPPVVQKVGKERTLYKFADYPNECAVMQLKSDASFYPKGGMVTIHPPTGEPWNDSPGVVNTHEGTQQSAGLYRVCKINPDAWGVEIWN